MTLKAYLWGMRIAWVVSAIALGLVVWLVDPQVTGFVGLGLFYASTLLFFASSFVLLLTWIWHSLQKNEDAEMIFIGVSFRQGFLLALLAILLLVFQQYRVLTWWDGALSVAGIFLVELFFLTRRGS
ncbi:MAG: hypothetical protein WCJ51_04455 [Candidatus Moraniibacteriota bacterium]